MSRRGKLGWALTAAVLALGIAAWSLRGQLGLWLFERAVEANAGIDPGAARPDGIRAFLCGSGSPLPDPDRAGPCIGIVAGKQAFVFDSGSGSVRKLLRMGFPIDNLQAVFLTHLHSDHVDGLGELLLQAWVGGSRATPLPVYGPEGVEGVVAGFRAAYMPDSGYRVAHHGAAIVPPGGFGGTAQAIPEPNGTPPSAVVWDRDGVRITVIRVNHAPVKPAFGYRIDYKGRSVALSGDTTYSADLAAAAKGVDVLFHEALQPRLLKIMERTLDRRGRKNAAQIMRDIPDYHTTPEDAARVATLAKAKTLVLYHLVPSAPGSIDTAFLGDAAKHFSGPLKVGRDGLLIGLPAGGTRIDFDQAL